MTKDFTDFENEIISNTELMSNIYDDVFKEINKQNIKFSNTENGIKGYTNNLINVSALCSINLTIKLLNLYHDWLNNELHD